MGRRATDSTLTIHMTAEYREYLTRLRRLYAYRSDSALIEAALAELASKANITPPPRARRVGYQGQKKSEDGG